jgi:acetyl-CoA synthetase
MNSEPYILAEKQAVVWRELYSRSDVCVAHLLCDRHPASRVALTVMTSTLGRTDYTFGELRELSERLAGVLREVGVQKGDRVATLLGKGVELVATVLAIWRLGSVHVPLFTAFAPAAIAYRLKESDTHVVVTDSGNRGKLGSSDSMPSGFVDPIICVDSNSKGDIDFWKAVNGYRGDRPKAVATGGKAPFILIYTSGATGEPKGVEVPVSMLAAFEAYMRFGIDLRETDVYWNAADPGWAYGLFSGIASPLLIGCPTLLLAAPFDAELTYNVLREVGVTNFAAVPTVYRSLRAAQFQIDPHALRLRALSSAGEPVSGDVIEWARHNLGAPIHDHYGQTEIGMVVNNHHAPTLALPLRPGSMGVPMPGFRVAILQDGSDDEAPIGTTGRLAIDVAASPLFCFRGYYHAPELTAERFTASGRYFLTGDSAQQNGDYISFNGRVDDVIIMAGYRIGPLEIENVLIAHPAVAEAAVVGAADDLRGETMHAFVTVRPGCVATQKLASELQQFVKSHYAAHAYPRVVHFVEQLPRTASGKVQKFVLRQKVEHDAPPSRDEALKVVLGSD